MSRRLTAAALALAAIALSGCISLFPKADPAQLYRFEARPPSQMFPPGPLFGVLRLGSAFPRASSGDRILTVNDSGEAAYIAGARWVSPAADLYMESIENAFAAQATRVRLIGPRELTRGQRSLDIAIRSFEARYDAPGLAPTIVVTARARLLVLPERTVSAERVFTVEQPATANRVSAIVEAFDLATRDINTQIVAWTDASAG